MITVRKSLASMLAFILTLASPASAAMRQSARPNAPAGVRAISLKAPGLPNNLSLKTSPKLAAGSLTGLAANAMNLGPAAPAPSQPPSGPQETNDISAQGGLQAMASAAQGGGDGKKADDGAGIAKFYDHSSADAADKGVPVEWVKKMTKEGRGIDPKDQRLREIVQLASFENAALNREVTGKHNDQYTVEIPMGPITNQESSGRCWIFAGLNMIRSVLVSEGKVARDFELSENFLHFFSMLEKSNNYLEKVVATAYKTDASKKLSREDFRKAVIPEVADGGWYEHFMFLVSKYGMAPKSAMRESWSSAMTETLRSELNDTLAAAAVEMLSDARKAGGDAKAIKERGMTRVWKILATHLGTPPERFEHRTEGETTREGGTFVTPARVDRFTPKAFADKFANFKAADYVVASSYPTKKNGVVYEVPKSAIGAAKPGDPEFNVRFMNVGLRRLEELALAAIKGGQPVWFAADVLNNVERRTGIMHPKIYDRAPLYGFTPEEEAKELSRRDAFYLHTNVPNHAMVLTGYDQPDAKAPVVKFKVENSWGPNIGSGGIFHLYREWFYQNVYEVIVHRKFLSEGERKAWDGKAKQVKDDADWREAGE